jgi:hypothetical protein
MNEVDIETLSNCSGMMDILEDAVRNEQAMPSALYEAIVKASQLRRGKDRDWVPSTPALA